MNIIYTLDEQNGTNLLGKRQSKDSVLADEILSMAKGLLYIKGTSLSFFDGKAVKGLATIVEDFDQVPNDAFIFTEEVLPQSIMDKADNIYVFRWNRRYPSMIQDRVNLDGYKYETTRHFQGNSHDKITLEVYNK